MTALSGEDAIKQVKEQSVDLILLDIMMPGMNGYEAAKHLRKLLPNIPIIMLTALQEETDALIKSFVAGANDFLSKPYRETELFTRIESHLQLHRYSRQLEEEVLLRTEQADRSLRIAIQAEQQRSLNTMVAGVAHELNTPLGNALLGSTTLLNKVKYKL